MSLIGDISEVFSKFAKFSGAIVSEDGDKTFFLHITWSCDQWLTWHSGWDTLTLNHKGCIIRGNRTQYQKYICITNWEKLALQIGAALFYYKLGQTLLQNGAAPLLQIGASVITNLNQIEEKVFILTLA